VVAVPARELWWSVREDVANLPVMAAFNSKLKLANPRESGGSSTSNAIQAGFQAAMAVGWLATALQPAVQAKSAFARSAEGVACLACVSVLAVARNVRLGVAATVAGSAKFLNLRTLFARE
jgi:hypothetical protein